MVVGTEGRQARRLLAGRRLPGGSRGWGLHSHRMLTARRNPSGRATASAPPGQPGRPARREPVAGARFLIADNGGVGGRSRGPERISAEVDSGHAELVRDPDRPEAWTLLVDGVPQSYVDLSNPQWLEFEYMRQLGAVLDLAAPSRTPLQVLHLGGGALTLPRYLAATRPGSVQRVVERDAALTALVRRVLPPRAGDFRVRAGDARAVVESTRSGRFDLVINDVYSGARMPGELATAEFASEVARVLRPGGWYAANVADGRSLDFVRGQVATLRTVFRQVCLIAEPGTLRRRRFGNLVLVAAGTGGRLPVARLAGRVTRGAFPARLLHGADLDRFVGGAAPVTDQLAADSPEPPKGIFARQAR